RFHFVGFKEKQCGGKIAFRRRPGTAPSSTAAFLFLRDKPEPARIARGCPFQGNGVGGTYRLEAFETVALIFRNRRKRKTHLCFRLMHLSEERLGCGFGKTTDRASNEDVEEHEGTGYTENQAKLARDGNETAGRLIEPHDLDHAQVVERA